MKPSMITSNIFSEIFVSRTTGAKRCFTIVNLSLDAVKIVLKGTQIKLETDGAEVDCENGFLKRVNSTGYYGGSDGYIPTAKGYRAILKLLL